MDRWTNGRTRPLSLLEIRGVEDASKNGKVDQEMYLKTWISLVITVPSKVAQEWRKSGAIEPQIERNRFGRKKKKRTPGVVFVFSFCCLKTWFSQVICLQSNAARKWRESGGNREWEISIKQGPVGQWWVFGHFKHIQIIKHIQHIQNIKHIQHCQGWTAFQKFFFPFLAFKKTDYRLTDWPTDGHTLI